MAWDWSSKAFALILWPQMDCMVALLGVFEPLTARIPLKTLSCMLAYSLAKPRFYQTLEELSSKAYQVRRVPET